MNTWWSPSSTAAIAHMKNLDVISKLPVEISSRIFSLACTDGGKTGVALLLVSKSFNVLSKPYTYQTVHLTSWYELCDFEDLVQRRKAEDAMDSEGHGQSLNFVVRHLLVDIWNAWTEDSDSDDGEDQIIIGGHFEDRGCVLNPLYDLVQLLSGHLKSLTVKLYFNRLHVLFPLVDPDDLEEPVRDAQGLLHSPYPNLSRVSLHGLFNPELKAPKATTHFPSITHVHFSRSPGPFPAGFLPYLTTAFPQLQYLTIPLYEDAIVSNEFPRYFLRALGHPTNHLYECKGSDLTTPIHRDSTNADVQEENSGFTESDSDDDDDEKDYLLAFSTCNGVFPQSLKRLTFETEQEVELTVERHPNLRRLLDKDTRVEVQRVWGDARERIEENWLRDVEEMLI
ncbi:hypothetical protein AX16_002148 [Volvariella volvacea WC 439]|nr:hypothetical protein AX16_002148 [Volvariella volvacea WC 439]